MCEEYSEYEEVCGDCYSKGFKVGYVTFIESAEKYGFSYAKDISNRWIKKQDDMIDNARLNIYKGISKAILAYMKNIYERNEVLDHDYDKYCKENCIDCDKEGFRHGAIGALNSVIEFIKNDVSFINGEDV